MRYLKVWSLILFALLCQGIFSQENPSPPATGGVSQKEGQKKGVPSTLKLYDVPPANEVVAPPTDDAMDYAKITQTQDAAQRATMIEDFLQRYPESKYVALMHQIATSAYQQLNNYDKVVEHAEKTVAAFPSNISMLSLLALAYTSHSDSDKAINRAGKAIDLLEKLTPPANADPARWNADRNQYLATNYASMGGSFVIKYEAEKVAQKKSQLAPAVPSIPAGTGRTPGDPAKPSAAPKASNETAAKPALPEPTPEKQLDVAAIHLAKAQGYLTKALELASNYDFAQFQLAVTYAYQGQTTRAIEAFARSIALNGNFATPARQNLEAIYKIAHKNSLDGLEDLVNKAKADLEKK